MFLINFYSNPSFPFCLNVILADVRGSRICRKNDDRTEKENAIEDKKTRSVTEASISRSKECNTFVGTANVDVSRMNRTESGRYVPMPTSK
jgi:hypothetical protein